MIKLNFKKAVGHTTFDKYVNNIKIFSDRINNLDIEGFSYLGVLKQPNEIRKDTIWDIKLHVKYLLKKHVELLIVIAEDCSNIKGAIEMIKGVLPENQKIEIMYLDQSLSANALKQKLKYAENKNFAINIISKIEIPYELAISFRIFKKLLENKVGINNAIKFISVTTDSSGGPLLAMARENKYKIFYIPSGVTEIYSSLTPSLLFPAACAGIKISNIIRGAKFANSVYLNPSLNDNNAYKYAVARNALSRNNSVEVMSSFEEQLNELIKSFQKMTIAAESKNEKGLIITTALFPNDANTIGQMIQGGQKNIFTTSLVVEKSTDDVSIPTDILNFDNINYLTEHVLSKISKISEESIKNSHYQIGGIPNITIQIEKMDEFNLGELIVFFQRASIMSAYINKVNPFNRKDTEIYRHAIYKSLGKP